MPIEAHLTAEEMFKLSEKVPRWFFTFQSIVDIKSLRGDVEGVCIEVLHSPYELGYIKGDRYEISAKVNDTNLGKHDYDRHSNTDSVKGEEIVKTAFEKAWNEYLANREKFRQKDVDCAKALIVS